MAEPATAVAFSEGSLRRTRTDRLAQDLPLGAGLDISAGVVGNGDGDSPRLAGVTQVPVAAGLPHLPPAGALERPHRLRAGHEGHSAGGRPYTPRYRDELSTGRAWRYLPVVATEACPSGAATRWIGAPRSRAWAASAWGGAYSQSQSLVPDSRFV